MTWALSAIPGGLLISALLLRRRPLLALAVTVGASAIITLNVSALIALQFVLPSAAGIEICYIAATRSRRVSVAGLVMAGIALLTPVFLLAVSSRSSIHNDAPDVLPAVVFVAIIAWLIGHSIRQAHAQAELVRAQAAAQAVLGERLRIARELHDIVAHSIGIIAIQAGAGRRVFDASPGEARDALAAIEDTSREALSGLRRMMTGLRHAETEPGQEALGPSPGLAEVERLAAVTLDAGVKVELDWHGSRAPLPADIDLSAFRIIQEAVTNVVRHARTSQCQVVIDQRDGQLSIEVADSGHGGGRSASTGGTGYGITGMRERAALLGGDFSAGPRPGGGFRVAATLPVPTSAR